MFVLFFFFFKQKTAYEMVSCDWSSDVCSSDLAGTNDMREIEQRAGSGDKDCSLAIAMYVHRVRKYVGAYAVAMGGVDVIAFTAGVGEHSALIRRRCSERLEFMGALLDVSRNDALKLSSDHPIAAFSAAGSRVHL